MCTTVHNDICPAHSMKQLQSHFVKDVEPTGPNPANVKFQKKTLFSEHNFYVFKKATILLEKYFISQLCTSKYKNICFQTNFFSIEETILICKKVTKISVLPTLMFPQ